MNVEPMFSGWLSAAVTLILSLCFFVVVIWAWSSRRKSEFDRAARMPLEEGKPELTEKQKTANGGHS